MRIKHLCVLIYIRNKVEVGTSSSLFTDRCKRCFVCGSFCHVCFVFVYHTVLSVPSSLMATCLERCFGSLVCNVFSCVFVIFSYCLQDQGWCLIDLHRFLILTFFLMVFECIPPCCFVKSVNGYQLVGSRCVN